MRLIGFNPENLAVLAQGGKIFVVDPGGEGEVITVPASEITAPTASGTYAVALRDTARRVTTALPALLVAPGPLDHFDVEGWPSELTAGDAIPAFWLIARDRFGNVAESFDGLVDLMLGDDLLGEIGPAAAGQVFFSGGGPLEEAGVFAIVARAAEFGVETALPVVTVRPGGLDHFDVPGWPDELTAGDPIGPLMIRAMDRFGNLVATFDAGVEVFVNGQGFGTAGPAMVGETPFTTFGDAIYEAGSYSVLLRSPDFGVETVLPAVTVRPGPIAGLAIAPLGAEIAAGGSFGEFTIKIADRYGNVVPGFGGTVELRLGDSVVAEYGSFVDGVVSVIGGRVITVSGTYTFVVRDALGLPVVFDAGDRRIQVLAGIPVALVVRSGDAQAGYPSEALPEPLRVRAEDAYGNGVPNTTVDFWVGDPGVELVHEPLRGARVTVATGPTGEAEVRAFLTDEVPDTAKVEVEIPMYPSSSHATFQVARSMSVVIAPVSGGEQIGLVGAQARKPLVVSVTTPAGRPVGGYFVEMEGPGAFFAVDDVSFLLTGGDGMSRFGFLFPEDEPSDDGTYTVKARVKGANNGAQAEFALTARCPEAIVSVVAPDTFNAQFMKLHAIRVACDLRVSEPPDSVPPVMTEFRVDAVNGPARYFTPQSEINADGRFTGILYPEATGDVSIDIRFPKFPTVRIREPAPDGVGTVLVRRSRLIVGPISVGGEPVRETYTTIVYTSSNGQLVPHEVSGEFNGQGVSARPIDGASGNCQIVAPGQESARPFRVQMLDARLEPRLYQWNTQTAQVETFEVEFSGLGIFRDALTGRTESLGIRARVSTQDSDVRRLYEEGPDSDAPMVDDQGNPLMMTIPAGTTEVYFTPLGGMDANTQIEGADRVIARVLSEGEQAPGRVTDYVSHLYESMQFIVLMATPGNAQPVADVSLFTDSNNDGKISLSSDVVAVPPAGAQPIEPPIARLLQHDDAEEVKNPKHADLRIASAWFGGVPPKPIQLFTTDPPVLPGRVVSIQFDPTVPRPARLAEVQIRLSRHNLRKTLELDASRMLERTRIKVWADPAGTIPLAVPYTFTNAQTWAAQRQTLSVYVEGVSAGIVGLEATHTDPKNPGDAKSDRIRLTIVNDASRPFVPVQAAPGGGLVEGSVLPGQDATLSIGIWRHAVEWVEPSNRRSFSWPALPQAALQIWVGANVSRTFVPNDGTLRWIQRITRRYHVLIGNTADTPVEYQIPDPQPVGWPELQPFNPVDDPLVPIAVELPFFFPNLRQEGDEASQMLRGGHRLLPDPAMPGGTVETTTQIDQMLAEGTPAAPGTFPGGPFTGIVYHHQFFDWSSHSFALASVDRLAPRHPARLVLTAKAGLSVTGLETKFETALVYYRPVPLLAVFPEIVILNAFSWGSNEELSTDEGWRSTARPIVQETSGPNRFGSDDFRKWIQSFGLLIQP